MRVQPRQIEPLQIAPWTALMRHEQQMHDTLERIAGVGCHQRAQEMAVALWIRRDMASTRKSAGAVIGLYQDSQLTTHDSRLSTRLTTRSPTARHDVSPGDSMPDA